jgi:signal transduction histidine kinase
MKTRKWLPVLPPLAVAVLGSQVYASLDAYAASWGAVLGGLYYIPIVITAITLGTRAAVGVAVAAGSIHMLAAAIRHDAPWLNAIAQIVLFICVALTAARLAALRRDVIRTTVQSAESGYRQCDSMRSEGGEWQPSEAIAGLVRQFRTPLTSIEGAGWVLEDPELAEEARQELVAIVRKEAHHLNRVLSDVIDFIHPHQPQFGPVNLAAVVDDVIQLARPKGKGPSVIFSREIPADLPPVWGDPQQLRQALLNLLTNSVQALPNGGRIAVSARVAGNQFVIAVEDNGRGIPADAADKILEPFFTTHENSLGLGLPATLRIVTEHGGRLELDTRRSKGVCVSIILPVRRAAPPR